MIVDLPIKTGRGLNDRMHAMKRHRLATKQRAEVCMLIKSAWWGRETLGPDAYAVNRVVTMTRKSFGTLDSDNLQGSLKATRDGIADFFKLDDNHPSITWRYAQEKCKRGQFGVRIQIEPAD